MIGAVSVELDNKRWIILYPVGAFADIDWESGKPLELDKGFLSYCYKDGHVPNKQRIIVSVFIMLVFMSA